MEVCSFTRRPLSLRKFSLPALWRAYNPIKCLDYLNDYYNNILGKFIALWGEPERQWACNSDLCCTTPNYQLWAAGCTLVTWPLFYSLLLTVWLVNSVSYCWPLVSWGSDWQPTLSCSCLLPSEASVLSFSLVYALFSVHIMHSTHECKFVSRWIRATYIIIRNDGRWAGHN